MAVLCLRRLSLANTATNSDIDTTYQNKLLFILFFSFLSRHDTKYSYVVGGTEKYSSMDQRKSDGKFNSFYMDISITAGIKIITIIIKRQHIQPKDHSVFFKDT